VKGEKNNMGYDRNNGRSFGGRDNFNRAPREMHKATCTKCGKACEVPFKPTEGKDVLCQDCFKAANPRRDSGRDSGRSFGGRNNFGNRDRPQREMHKATCAGCGNECEVPFKPTEGRDVFCSDCFKKNNSRN